MYRHNTNQNTRVIIWVITIILLPVLLVVGLKYQAKKNGKTDSTNANSNQTSEQTNMSPSPSNDANSNLVSPTDAVIASKVILKTSKGDINLDLYPDAAPIAVKNFVTLGKRGYYNDVIFHRVIKDFMIQAGDPTGTGTGGESIYGTPFAVEQNQYKYVPGTLGMAKTLDPVSNGSQFFIVTEQDQPSLDGGYTIFGQADEASMAVVKAIAAVPTDSNDKPTSEVKITGFEIVQ